MPKCNDCWCAHICLCFDLQLSYFLPLRMGLQNVFIYFSLLEIQKHDHNKYFIHQFSQVLVQWPLNPFIIQSILTFGTAQTQVQNLSLDLVERHEVSIGPPTKPVKALMTSLPSIVSTGPVCLVSSASLLSVHSIPLSIH